MKIKNFFSNKSKGDVLLDLENRNTKFKIPRTIVFNVKEWKKNKKLIYKNVRKLLNNKVAVRSSSGNEDLQNYSGAGKYLSFLNVNTFYKKNFYNSVNRIIKSYVKKNKRYDKIIVQNMVTMVKSSGVAFTKDLENGANYYVINYDDVTGKTNTVTSGQGHYSNRILYIYKKFDNQIKSKRFKKLIDCIKDLEKKIGLDDLDIEFAINNKLEIYLLQVRPISTTNKWHNKRDEEINKSILSSEKKVNKIFNNKNNHYRSNTILGNMPDWNPVEIIGKYPSQLSVSLYKYLITDNIWAKARSFMGYKNMTGNKLMHIICGQPYIDTRLSLYSFLPKAIKNSTSKKVVNHGIKLLKKYPFLHDKIEFKISVPSFDFTSQKKINKLFNKVLNQKEKKYLLSEIKNLTKKAIEFDGIYSVKYCSNEIDKLNYEFEKDNKSNMNNLDYLIQKCRDIGTLNFSILARHGFIAKSFLDSLIEKKVLEKKEVDLFEQNLNTITTQMLNDSIKVRSKSINKKQFMKKYGHLRPGTYDIESKKYAQMKNFKFSARRKKHKSFYLSKEQKLKINQLLKKNGFSCSSDKFLNYLKTSLILREYSKFVFTKYLSLILEIIAKFAKKKSLSRSQISNVDINNFLNKKFQNLRRSNLLNLINKNKDKINLNKQIKLPSLIIDRSNLRVIPFQVNQPNFVTRKKIEGEYIYLSKFKNIKKLDNKIIVIENADPGYDWIFAFKILGLVTKFGGINSHMAIRCSELSIPAVIGCGEQIFSDIINYQKKQIFIDCSASLIYSN